MDSIDCVVIGAGVVGLAIARAAALQGREVLLVEREGAIGTQTSSRNSEVIHAGLYYPAGSLKARLCVKGRDQLYEYCEHHQVAHKRCGKLIVATTEGQLAELAGIRRSAEANDVTDLRSLTAAEARALEPELACTGALLSPSTGIIDSHGYMLSLQGEAEAHGAMVAFGTRMTAIVPHPRGLALSFNGAGSPSVLAHTVINAAGLFASEVADTVAGLAPAFRPRTRYAKGSYFTSSGRAAFGRLIYPVPEPGGLGVHLTLDLGGQARFGPDVAWVESLDYTVDPEGAARFYSAIRRYWPGLADGALAPGYAGIRPKMSGPGEPAADFRIDGPDVHGVPGLINLFGIESPGLTASLALADEIVGTA
jgi:L-2-hydroxyglutarate oxidase LhgO